MAAAAGARVAPLRVMTTRSATASAIAALLVGCGSDPTPEVVVADPGGVPTLLGVSDDGVYWTTGSGAMRRISGANLDALPSTSMELVPAATIAVQARDHVLAVSGQNVMRASVLAPATRIATTDAEVLAESDGPVPRLVWTVGNRLSWGDGDLQGSATLNRTTTVDHIRAASNRYWAAADGSAGSRLVFVDRDTTASGTGASAARFAESFPGGGADGATYTGRIVDATNESALWLVEESPSHRGVLVEVTPPTTTKVLLDHIQGAGAFFATADAFYWQEKDVLLTAPRAGGAASIAAELDGTAGAVADGFVYYVTPGGAIERLAL